MSNKATYVAGAALLVGVVIVLTLLTHQQAKPVFSSWSGGNSGTPFTALQVGGVRREDEGRTHPPASDYRGPNDEDKPWGRPIDPSRDDWRITQTNAEHWQNEGLGGLDFAFVGNRAASGSPLHATERGLVGTLKDRADGTGYGNAVYILGYVNPATGMSYNTVYGHFSKVAVKDGDAVKRGDRLGEMGSTGFSSGPHIHYEVWQCQRPATTVVAGIKPGEVNHSSSECKTIDPQPFTVEVNPQ